MPGIQRKRVLIVENQRTLARRLSEMLGQGYIIDTAFSGYEALYQLRRRDYHLLLVDYKLQGSMNGMDVIREAREDSPDAHAVLMTSYDVDKLVRQLGAANVIPYRDKPRQKSQICATVLQIATGLRS